MTYATVGAGQNSVRLPQALSKHRSKPRPKALKRSLPSHPRFARPHGKPPSAVKPKSKVSMATSATGCRCLSARPTMVCSSPPSW